MARKQAGKHSRNKSNATSSAVKDSGSPSDSTTPAPTNATSSNANANAATLALPSTTPTTPGPSGLPLIYRLLLLLYPILQMLLSVEAPLRPFSALRDPITQELITSKEELIEPRILVVAPHARDLGFFAPTIGILKGTEERKGRSWVGVLGLSSSDKSKRGKGEGRQEEWKDALETFGSGLVLDVGLLDVPELQDTPESVWDPNVVEDVVLSYVLEHNIDTILTFDEGGITGNPHHTAVSKGITSLVRSQKLKDALSPPSPSSPPSSADSNPSQKAKGSFTDRLWGGKDKSKEEDKLESDKDAKEEEGNGKEKEKEKVVIHPRAYLLRTPTSLLLNPGLGPLSPIVQHFILVSRAFRGNKNSTTTSTSSSSSASSSSSPSAESDSVSEKVETSTPTPSPEPTLSPVPAPPVTFISNIWIYGRSWKALLKLSEELYLGNVLGWFVSRSLWVNEWVEVS